MAILLTIAIIWCGCAIADKVRHEAVEYYEQYGEPPTLVGDLMVKYIYSIHHIPYGDRNMPDKVAVRIGSGGRVVIPKSYLKEQGIEEGEIVLVSLSKAKVEEADHP